MATIKTELVEIELPRDIIFAMRGLQKPEEVKKKLKIALAIFLFQERAISLGKATELTEMSRHGLGDALYIYSFAHAGICWGSPIKGPVKRKNTSP